MEFFGSAVLFYVLTFVFVIAVVTLGVVFIGAPYVPTRARDLDKLFEVAQLDKTDVLVDLGSGDGRLLLAAAERGVRSYGVEVNPLLVIVSWWRIHRIRRLARIYWGNFWNKNLPDDTTVVFVFLAKPFMNRLRAYLEVQSRQLGRPLILVSYGFALPGYKTIREKDAVLVYKIKG